MFETWQTAVLFLWYHTSKEKGLCVQCIHVGPYDNEPATLAAIEEYAKSQGLELDFGKNRFHHEIYFSDVRQCQPVRKVILKQLETQSPF